MQTALFHLVVLPPPAACPFVLAWRGRASARSAADRGVSTVVERVVRELVVADVVPDVCLRPGRQRSDLGDSLVFWIEGNDLGVRPSRRLLAAQAGDPGVVPAERSVERTRLSNIAAQPPHLVCPVREVAAVRRDHPPPPIRGRGDHPDLAPLPTA